MPTSDDGGGGSGAGANAFPYLAFRNDRSMGRTKGLAAGARLLFPNSYRSAAEIRDTKLPGSARAYSVGSMNGVQPTPQAEMNI